ncbi:hypothetical protein N9A94_01735 [Akkermansiaceae bacterium]|nr:hypothetical protein [Akkermansiaceae bacterium]MDB4537424.1 hypothetical protein [Akkermansiaceae bacterium]MDB4544547.1 hypothetical protein [Akkermansiaceae bacterium]
MKPDLSLLKTLFPPKRIDPNDMDGTPPELGCYMRDFKGDPWDEVPLKFYSYHSDAFCLMDHDTLLNYFAGFLNASFDEKDASGEFLVYFSGSENFPKFCELLTDDQCEFTIKCLDYHILTDDYYDLHDAIAYDKQRAKIFQNRLK